MIAVLKYAIVWPLDLTLVEIFVAADCSANAAVVRLVFLCCKPTVTILRPTNVRSFSAYAPPNPQRNPVLHPTLALTRRQTHS